MQTERGNKYSPFLHTPPPTPAPFSDTYWSFLSRLLFLSRFYLTCLPLSSPPSLRLCLFLSLPRPLFFALPPFSYIIEQTGKRWSDWIEEIRTAHLFSFPLRFHYFMPFIEIFNIKCAVLCLQTPLLGWYVCNAIEGTSGLSHNPGIWSVTLEDLVSCLILWWTKAAFSAAGQFNMCWQTHVEVIRGTLQLTVVTHCAARGLHRVVKPV